MWHTCLMNGPSNKSCWNFNSSSVKQQTVTWNILPLP
jgi:hypothetical protein